MVWLMVIVIYQAPPQSVDWDGPWKFGKAKMIEQQFATEAECRNSAVQLIGRLHQGMLAPVRYRCLPVDGALAKGAQR